MYKRLKRKLLKRLNGILGKKLLLELLACHQIGGLFFILKKCHANIKRISSIERKKESKR